MKTKNKKIGALLLENKFITKNILKEALDYSQHFGVGITQYLITRGYIDETALAKCICEQFKVPYLPLSVYRISNKVIKMIPVNLVAKHWLIPVDRFNDTLTIVMSDPFNTVAIEEIKKFTGCTVQIFVGLSSDITSAIKKYYHVDIRDIQSRQAKTPPPLYITTPRYEGFERRESIRLNIEVEIHFPVQKIYEKSKTKDISPDGILFESRNALPLDSYVTLQVSLPKGISSMPIAAVAQVVRVLPVKNKSFDIGAKLVKIPKEDLKLLLTYAHNTASDK